MKASIPNILPMSGFFLCGGIATIMVMALVDTFNQDSLGLTIFFIIFTTLMIFMSALLCFRLKILLLDSDNITLIRPFRLDLKSINFNEIKQMHWEIWETHKFGEYRKLILETSTDFKFNISDLEFMNFNSLEGTLLERTNTKPNLNDKTRVRIQQALYNKWVNICMILILGVFLLMPITTLDYSDPSPVKLFGIGIISFLIWRLSLRLSQYFEWSKKYSSIRKRRLKNISTRK